MLRYGKRHDRRYNDKISRSNRGRARTSATGSDRAHAILGYRRGHEQRVELRTHKKHFRLSARLLIQEELFDRDLSRSDPELWLHGTDLTRFKDIVTRRHRGYPASFADPFSYVLDAYDSWELDPSYQDRAQDRADEARDLLWDEHDYDYGAGYDWDMDLTADPEPIDAAWRDLWVAGHAHDAEGRDAPDDSYDRRYDDYYDLDELADLENPLLEREDPATSATIEALDERNLERQRAGDRYFKQHGRTARAPRYIVVEAAR